MVSRGDAPKLELVLVNGERRSFTLPGHSGSIGNALARFDDWIQMDDGGWVQKSFIVEVRGGTPADSPGESTA
jgi:hypothetical protein